MRKMTYTQAATCGENLKVKVTPEQSEKMQRAGKTWQDGSLQHDFASQQAVWAWLGQGTNKVKNKTSGCVYGFNGKYGLFNFTDDDLAVITFDFYRNWQKYTPPKLIMVNGIEVPAPLESLDGFDSNQFVWVVCFSVIEDKVLVARAGSDFAQNSVKLRLVYANEADARLLAKAMLEFEVVE